jgi:hypothetical protein
MSLTFGHNDIAEAISKFNPENVEKIQRRRARPDVIFETTPKETDYVPPPPPADVKGIVEPPPDAPRKKRVYRLYPPPPPPVESNSLSSPARRGSVFA